MVEVINALQPYLLEIIGVILTGIATFLGTRIKKLYEERVSTETAEKIVRTVVNAVEQLYKDFSGEEKLNSAMAYASEMLESKGIEITELELRMLIESTVNSFKQANK